MKCIAKKGMSGTTLGDVASEAGLSQGIVNLHFESKENLLNETMHFLAEEYKTQFDNALDRSGPGPSDKLRALMELDLRPSICDRRKLAVWFAFWGEVKLRPAYLKVCAEYDRYYDEAVANICREVIAEGAYEDLDPDAMAIALTALTNGLWLSCLISPQPWDRSKAMDAVLSYLSGVFPEHFESTGPSVKIEVNESERRLDDM